MFVFLFEGAELIFDLLWVNAFLFEVQQFFEVLYFSLEFADGVGVVAVDLCRFDFEGDVVGAFYEFERVYGLFEVAGGGGEVGHDEGVGVAG